MNNISKGRSPFYPSHLVPIELFTGREKEIKRIARAIGQVELGKFQGIFLAGEYGIGKSSLASFMKHYAERKNHLLGIHVLLGGAETLEDVATKTVETVIEASIYEPTAMVKIRDFLARYIGRQELFGFSINLEVLKADSPSISRGYLPFLRELLERFKDSGIKGIMLILDEINGITRNPKFAHFIKTLVDENALSPSPLPLLLMLCGVEERRREMIECHQPVERIFDIVDVEPMNKEETGRFFQKAFESVSMQIAEEAMDPMCYFSMGFPKIMHIIGDNIFWADQDGIVDEGDAAFGILSAAEEVGKKFVDQQVYKALRSKDYHSILSKVGMFNEISFIKRDIEKNLSGAEKKKFHNFLQRMKKLNVLRPGNERGEYVFNSRLVQTYIFLNSSSP